MSSMTCSMPSFSRPPAVALHMGAVSARRIAGMYSSRTEDLKARRAVRRAAAWSAVRQCRAPRACSRSKCPTAARVTAVRTAAAAAWSTTSSCPADGSCCVKPLPHRAAMRQQRRTSHAGKRLKFRSPGCAPIASRRPLHTRTHHQARALRGLPITVRAPQYGARLHAARHQRVRHQRPAL